MRALLQKVFGSGNQRQLKNLDKTASEIEALEPSMQQLSDHQLQNKTAELKQRYQNGETLDDLLVEAYAVVREASTRVLGLHPYNVQLLGAIAMHHGDIAEMKTGEGKTLASTMPVY
ncbi:preprotein translocase subunit SecA, partial [Gracilibacillus oryzae]